MTFNQWENIGIICEGSTELNFVKIVLKPFFKDYFISLKPIKIKDNDSMEGNISIDRLVTYINKSNYKIVTTLVDYYGFKKVCNLLPDQIINQIKNKSNKENLIPYM